MKVLGRFTPFLILAVGLIGSLALSRFKKDPPTVTPPQQSAVVEVVSAQECNEGFDIDIDGEVIPYRQVTLSAEVGGRIAKKSEKARAGNYVRAGDLLFEIDRRDYELEVRRLKEIVNQAGSSIEELDVENSNVEELVILAEEQLELQRKEFRRFEALRKKNATSTSQLESVRQAELQSLNSLQTLKNQITLVNARRNRLAQEKERALTDLARAELQLSRTAVRSPVDAVVIQDFAEQDDFVQTGTQLIQLEDTAKAEVRFSLRMEQLRWLWGAADREVTTAPQESTFRIPQIPVQVQVEIDGNRFSWVARLDRYDGAGVNSETRTVPLIAVVENPASVQLETVAGALPLASPPTLLRGSYVSVKIPVGQDMNLLSVPTPAFQPNSTVWVYDQGRLRIVPVRVAYSDSEKVILLTDPAELAANDQVVVSPLPVAEEGMKIRLPGAAPADGIRDQVPTTMAASDSNSSDPM